jgi:hypothetical protein
MRPMRRRWVVLGVVAGGACFAAGVGSARYLGASAPQPSAPDAGPSVSLFPADAGAGPRIVIDPDAIQLLPDASLRLELPPGFDAGAP